MPDEHLKEFVERVRPSQGRSGNGEAAVESMLPEYGDGYQAHARASGAPVFSLHCFLGEAGCRSFQYVHLNSDSSFTVDRRGQAISLQFSSVKTVAVTIRGRNLRKLYDLIHQHRVSWVMQLDAGRDFGPDAEPVVTKIEFAEVSDADDRVAAHGAAKVLEMG